MKVTLKGTEYEIKNSFRGMIIYENIMGETFKPKGIQELLTLFYSLLLGTNKGCTLSFDDFMEALDETPDVLNQFTKWFADGDKVEESTKKSKPAKRQAKKK